VVTGKPNTSVGTVVRTSRDNILLKRKILSYYNNIMCAQYVQFQILFIVWPINRQRALIRRLLWRARIRIKRTTHGTTVYSPYYYWHDHNIIITVYIYGNTNGFTHMSTKRNISHTLRFVLSKWLVHVMWIHHVTIRIYTYFILILLLLYVYTVHYSVTDLLSNNNILIVKHAFCWWKITMHDLCMLYIIIL